MTYIDAIQATLVCLVVLVIKFYFTLSIQGSKRFQAGTRVTEDSVFGKGVQSHIPNPAMVASSEERVRALEEDERWRRIVMNDLENIPLGLICAFFSLAYAAPFQSIAHIVLIVVFTAARIGHTICFAKALQPWRSITWTVAVLCVHGLALNAMISAFVYL